MLKAKLQSYGDGVCIVCTASDSSESGAMPNKKLTPKAKLRFNNRTVGMKRYFEAAMADIKIDLVIRIPRRLDISTQDVVLIGGEQYEIKQIQQPDKPAPLSTDLSLERIEKVYDTTGI